jgi:hypothetical protein
VSRRVLAEKLQHLLFVDGLQAELLALIGYIVMARPRNADLPVVALAHGISS